jgi:UDP-glucose:tetrahydrobiopterin glucosyltransferase
LGQIDRAACRRRAAAEYSLGAMADRLEAWFEDILAD